MQFGKTGNIQKGYYIYRFAFIRISCFREIGPKGKIFFPRHWKVRNVIIQDVAWGLFTIDMIFRRAANKAVLQPTTKLHRQNF
jgi:hypothetical protein